VHAGAKLAVLLRLALDGVHGDAMNQSLDGWQEALFLSGVGRKLFGR
jgi:hypothetical protein